MRKITLLLTAIFVALSAAHAQSPKNSINNGVQLKRLNYIDPDIFTFIGKNDNVMHMVWDEVTSEPVDYYVVEQSFNGADFQPLDSIRPVRMFDIFANNYPQGMDYNNKILYSTETGSGRFIYNDELNAAELQQLMIWYRIRIVTAKGNYIYTTKMKEVVNGGDGGNFNQESQNSNPNLPAQFSNTGLGGTSNDFIVARQMVGCPSAQTPPSGYIYTGNFRTFSGECCFWEEREYRLAQITAPCGSANAWCCNFDCAPLAYDPCCVHTCGEYNQCSCHPWTCCNVNNSNIWIVYSSTNYSIGATINNITDVSCNGRFDGSVSIGINDSIPLVFYNWDNGSITGSLLNNLAAGIYSLTASTLDGCSETLNFNITEPPALNSTISARNVSCFGIADGIVDVSVSGGVPPYSYNWLDGSTALSDTTQDLVGVGPGNYAVTVTDQNGCVSNEFLPVTSPDEFTGVVRLTDLTCPDAGSAILELCCYGSNTGSAVLELSGGTPPVSFIWDDGSTGSEYRNLSAGTYSVTAIDANGCSFDRTFTLGQRDEILLSAVTTTTACGECNGSAFISVDGGSGAFSYQWPPSVASTTNTASNLCAGSYTVIVNDLFATSCFKAITVTINNIGAETITTGKTDASCFGACDGTASVSFNCSDAPCTVTWFDTVGNQLSTDNSISGLCAGTYSVVVSNSAGCTAAQTVDILEPAKFDPGLNLVNETCFGACDGIASAAPTGGASPYTLSWLDSNGTSIGTSSLITGLCAGAYELVVTDNAGCTASFPFNITSFNNLFATWNVTHNLCFGDCNGSITVTASGGTAPYSFQWFSNGVQLPETGFHLSSLCAGTYTMQVTDQNGCTYTTPDIFVIENPEPTASIATTDLSCTSICNGAAVITASGGSGALIYEWFDNFGVLIGSATGASEDSLCAGDYFAEVSDSNGCTTGRIPFTINDINPLVAALTESNVSCFGAADGAIAVDISGGFPPYNFSWSNGATSEDLSALSSGTYTVVITDSSGCSITESATVASPDNLSTAVAVKTYGAGGYHVSCSGSTDGEITVTATGGTAPYSYAWDDPAGQIGDAAIGLGLGTYSVTVTDLNGCTAANSATLSLEPGPFTSDISAFVYASGFNVSCFGASDGSIDVTVTGGEPPFRFGWTRNGTAAADITDMEDPANITAGLYTVNIVDTSLGCITRDTILLTEPSEIVLTLTPSIYPGGVNISTPGGSDGSIDLEVSGGFAPYAYAWSNSETTQDLSNLTAGTYTVSVTDSLGCTASATIALREAGASITTIDTSICEGDSIFAGGAFQTEAGTYTDSLLNQFGLDSIVITNLSVLPASRTDVLETICSGSSFFAGGADQTQSGTYYDTLTAANGCDSIIATMLTVTPPDIINTVDVTICFGDGYFAGGDFQTESGTYVDTTSGSNGCDSIWDVTNLTVLPELITTIDVQICDGASYFAGGAFQTESGTYYDTLVTSLNCDSVIVTNLEVLTALTTTLDVQICDGASYFAGGDFQTESGTYYDTLVTSLGCDSVVVTNLEVLTVLTTTVDVQICDGASYFAGGDFQTEPGTYYDTLVTSIGCDSVVVTNLEVLTVLTTTVDVQICDGASYFAGGAFQTEPGTYYDTLVTALGCDSVVVTNLTVSTSMGLSLDVANPNCADSCGGSITANATGGQEPLSFLWSDGQTSQTATGLCAGTHAVTVTDASGCSASESGTISAFQEIAVTVTSQDISAQCGGNRMCELNFGDFPPGTKLNEQYAAYGIHISGNAYGSFPDQLTIYNADGNGPDPDLQTADGHVAIFPENITDADGNGTVDVPNDQGQGGVITITFDYDRTVTSFVFVDKENGPAGTAKAYDANNNLLTTVAIPNVGNGSVQTIAVNATGVRKIVFDYRDSGGLTDILLDCNPRCCDGSAAASATGGNPPLSYSWSNGATTAAIDNLCPGTYTVTVTDADGCSGTQTVTVNDCENNVTGLTIVRENFGGDVAPFTEGMTISLDTLCPFNLRANLCIEPVGSVQFILNGNDFRVEEYIPYALAGDNPTGNYHDWVSTPGSYTLDIIPYSGPRATGTAGSTFTSTFTVIGQSCNSSARLSSSVADLSTGFEIDVYPIPFNDKLVIDLNVAKASRGSFEVMDILGRKLIVQDIEAAKGLNSFALEAGNWMPDAVYFLEVRLDTQVKVVKLIKAE